MIRVLFDDTEIDSNYIMKITQTVNPYTQGFCLGSTICRQFSIDIHSAANVSTPDNVYLYEDNDSDTQSDWSLYATLFVDSVETTDDNHITFNLTDIMVRFNTLLNYQGTVLSILNSICSDKGISLNTQDFYMKDYEVGEVTINERDLISYIAEVNGGYAYIDNNGNLNICRYENKAYSNIDSDMCSSIKVGAYHKIGRVSFDLTGTEEVYPSVTEYDTVSLNPDNIILQNESTRASIMKDIYSFIKGFAFYNIKIEKCPIDPDIRAGQLINVGGWRNLLSSGEEYITTLTGERILVSDGLLIPFLCEIDWNYNTQWLGGYTTDLENATQEATPIVSVQEKVSKLKWELDDPTSGVKAQLELKVAKDDNDQIISMINASADNIILNTKSLIFGEYPEGQYIEVKNYYSNNTPIGVIFEGTGQVRFSSQGRFQARNFINGKSANSFYMYVTDSAYAVSLANSYVNGKSNYNANEITMNSYTTSGGESLTNVLRIGNNQAGASGDSSTFANAIILDSTGAGMNDLRIINYDNEGNNANSITMYGFGDDSNNASFKSYFKKSSVLANDMNMYATETTNYLNLNCYDNEGGVPIARLSIARSGTTPSVSLETFTKTSQSTASINSQLFLSGADIKLFSGDSGSVYIDGRKLSFSDGYVKYI